VDTDSVVANAEASRTAVREFATSIRPKQMCTHVNIR